MSASVLRKGKPDPTLTFPDERVVRFNQNQKGIEESQETVQPKRVRPLKLQTDHQNDIKSTDENARKRQENQQICPPTKRFSSEETDLNKHPRMDPSDRKNRFQRESSRDEERLRQEREKREELRNKRDELRRKEQIERERRELQKREQGKEKERDVRREPINRNPVEDLRKKHEREREELRRLQEERAKEEEQSKRENERKRNREIAQRQEEREENDRVNQQPRNERLKNEKFGLNDQQKPRRDLNERVSQKLTQEPKEIPKTTKESKPDVIWRKNSKPEPEGMLRKASKEESDRPMRKIGQETEEMPRKISNPQSEKILRKTSNQEPERTLKKSSTQETEPMLRKKSNEELEGALKKNSRQEAEQILRKRSTNQEPEAQKKNSRQETEQILRKTSKQEPDKVQEAEKKQPEGLQEKVSVFGVQLRPRKQSSTTGLNKDPVGSRNETDLDSTNDKNKLSSLKNKWESKIQNENDEKEKRRSINLKPNRLENESLTKDTVNENKAETEKESKGVENKATKISQTLPGKRNIQGEKEVQKVEDQQRILLPETRKDSANKTTAPLQQADQKERDKLKNKDVAGDEELTKPPGSFFQEVKLRKAKTNAEKPKPETKNFLEEVQLKKVEPNPRRVSCVCTITRFSASNAAS